MKRIIKLKSPSFFEDWKKEFINTNSVEPQYKKDFVGEIKQLLKYELLKEQGYICCYCMAPIEFNSHIEHFVPQSKSNRDLDYFNMMLSCNGYNGDCSHCGHKKDDWFDENIIISPMSEDVEDKFTYLVDGYMDSNIDNAKVTIEKLGLNNFALKRARRSAIYNSGLFTEDLTKEQVNDLIGTFSNRDNSQAYTPFCQALVYCLTNNF